MKQVYKNPRYKNAKPQQKPYKLTDGKGLYLLIYPNGSKYWRYDYSFNGKRKTLAIGVYPDITLTAARETRKWARLLLNGLKDPVREKQLQDARKQQAANNSFKVVALEWYETQKGGWKGRHAERVLSWMERDLFPDLGMLPVSEILPTDVLRVIKSVEKRGALDVAKRQRARCEQIFRYAIQTGHITNNPAADLVGTVKTEKVTHRPALGRDELGGFLRQLATFERINEVNRLALKLLVLTFVRPGELRGGMWDEFNLERKEWRIPAERMKMEAELIVPLSAPALNLLEELRPITGKSPYLFPGERNLYKPISDATLPNAMKRMGYQGKATPHGFRSTASTVLNETGFDPDVIERQLAHIERNKVRAAYHRAEYLDDRRKMMDWWGKFVESAEHGADVVPIGSQQS